MLFVDVRSSLREGSQEQLNISSECNSDDTYCDENRFGLTFIFMKSETAMRIDDDYYETAEKA